MDPNETLRQLRGELATDRAFIGEPVKELFEALDEWLTKGGFLPTEWER